MKRILLILAILVGVFLLYKLVTYQEPGFEKVELDKGSSLVFNTTPQAFMDTIVYVGLTNLEITDVVVILKPLNINPQKDEDRTMKAHIIGAGKQYVIYVDELSRKESILILAHELIHLQQYESGRLIVKNKVITWQHNPLPLEDWMSVSYSNRPWEQEAFKLQGDLSEKISKELYK